MLIYLSYPLMDYDKPPAWVEPFKRSLVVQMEHWSCYDPILGFSGNVESDPGLVGILSNPKRVSALAVKAASHLRLDPELFNPLSKALPRLQAADAAPTADVAFKNIYALLRANVVVADLENPDHGEKTQEVMYAYLIGVPVVGVAQRFMFSPYVAEKISAFVRPDPNAIVRQVLAHDHKTNAMLRYYDALQNAQQAQHQGRSLADLQAKLEAAKRATEEADALTEEQSEDGKEPRDSPV